MDNMSHKWCSQNGKTFWHSFIKNRNLKKILASSSKKKMKNDDKLITIQKVKIYIYFNY